MFKTIDISQFGDNLMINQDFIAAFGDMKKAAFLSAIIAAHTHSQESEINGIVANWLHFSNAQMKACCLYAKKKRQYIDYFVKMGILLKSRYKNITLVALSPNAGEILAKSKI